MSFPRTLHAIVDARKVLNKLGVRWQDPLTPEGQVVVQKAIADAVRQAGGESALRVETRFPGLRVAQVELDLNSLPRVPTIRIPLPEPTTLWDFPTQSYGATPKGNNKYPGVTPALVIWNMVQRYTRPGDLVVDPMCGSGTSIDVCTDLGRKCKGFDVVPTRPDIVKNDARRIPLPASSVDMVFIDSPYGDNIRYNAAEENFGNISAETESFYDELEKTITEAHRILRPGKVLGWVIADQWVKKRFTAVGFRLWERLLRHFEPVDIITLVRRSQVSNTSIWASRARRFNFYLRGFKYLFIVRKADPSARVAPAGRPGRVRWAAYKK